MNNFIELFVLPLLVGLVLLVCGHVRSWSTKKKAIYTSCLVLVALVLSYLISEHKAWVMAGTVVDSATNAGIGQAQIDLVGSSTSYSTEDNGNFRFDVRPGLFGAERIKIHVTKKGYHPMERSFEPPVENIILRMEKP